jgi:hypothetical protein
VAGHDAPIIRRALRTVLSSSSEQICFSLRKVLSDNTSLTETIYRGDRGGKGSEIEGHEKVCKHGRYSNHETSLCGGHNRIYVNSIAAAACGSHMLARHDLAENPLGLLPCR